ncbi:MAG: DNA polymerase III subunit beta [Pseudomonadota bacterium]|jgi:DNA polymerase-3 subunit beta
MEITIPKAELAKLLHITLAIAEKKTTMPILGNLLLNAEDGSLKITASDIEVTAVASAKASVKKKGSITVSAKMFGDLVRELADGDVTIKTGERDRVEVISSNSKLKIMGVGAEEYPVPTSINLATKCKLSAQTLVEMINKTLYAVSLDEGRYNMNGVCLELVSEGKKSALRMVATDGHRLALITRPLEGVEFTSLVAKGAKKKEAETDHVIVPRKGLSEVRKALETVGDVPVGVDVIDGFLVVEGGAWKLVVQLLDSEFPNYEQVLPKAEGVKVAVLSSHLEHALKRVSLVVSDKNKGVRLDFFNNLVRISSSSPEVGEGQEEVEVQYKGRELSVGFNARYIIDALATIGENQPFILELSGETGPGKMYAEADESAIGIVMPLRLE